jgi:hypothetical protein
LTEQLKSYDLIGYALLAAGMALAVTIASRTNSSERPGNQGSSVVQADRCAGFNRDGTYFMKQNASLPDRREYCKVLTYDRPEGKVVRESMQNPCRECP